MTGSNIQRHSQVGIDRIIHLAWLEQTAALVQGGNDADATRQTIHANLLDSFRYNQATARGSIDKTLTVLLRVWLRPPPELASLRDRGLELLQCLPQPEQPAVHWGMIMAVYPFWARVAAQVGRLLRLQDVLTVAHIQRRMREQYGERETVSRSAQRILRSYVGWSVLAETEKKGVYKRGATTSLVDARLAAWLIEASLHARTNGTAPLQELLDSPSLFPFRLSPVQASVLAADSAEIEVIRHGLNEDLVMLRR